MPASSVIGETKDIGKTALHNFKAQCKQTKINSVRI